MAEIARNAPVGALVVGSLKTVKQLQYISIKRKLTRPQSGQGEEMKLQTKAGKHIVMINGGKIYFNSIDEALTYIFMINGFFK